MKVLFIFFVSSTTISIGIAMVGSRVSKSDAKAKLEKDLRKVQELFSSLAVIGPGFGPSAAGYGRASVGRNTPTGYYSDCVARTIPSRDNIVLVPAECARRLNIGNKNNEYLVKIPSKNNNEYQPVVKNGVIFEHPDVPDLLAQLNLAMVKFGRERSVFISKVVHVDTGAQSAPGESEYWPDGQRVQ